MRRTCSLTIAGLLLTAAANASDWPQWRGANRDGVALASQLPKQWPTALPAPAWTTVVGEGYSSPVIAGGRVYLMGRDAGSKETCLCFDAASGKPVWKYAYASDYEPPDPRAGAWPKSTPTVDGDRVYMLGLGGMFHCLDAATGRVLWNHDFRKEFWGVEKDADGVDSWFPVCGSAASPLALDGQVIVPVGGKKAGALAAFDRKDGKLLWAELPDRSSYGSPISVSVAGTPQVVGFTGLRMVGLDRKTHKLSWELPFPAMFEQTITTPVVWKDLLVVTGEQKPTIGLRVTKDGGTFKTTEAWKNSDLKAYLNSPVIAGDHLYGADSATKRLICVDLATGTTKWTSPRLPGIVGMIVAGDRLLAQTIPGDLIMIKTDGGGYTELGRWKVTEAGDVWAYPALAGGKLFIKDKTNLLCYDLGGKAASLH